MSFGINFDEIREHPQAKEENGHDDKINYNSHKSHIGSTYLISFKVAL